jgi:hypothetical protein
MSSKFIYPDTSIWNRLCKENADPHALTSTLRAKNSVLVLGENVLIELARAFESQKAAVRIQARQLFSYMQGYLRMGIPVLKPNWAVMIEEALHLTGDGPEPTPFVDDYPQLLNRVNELADGAFGTDVQNFTKDRKRLVEQDRSGLPLFVKTHPALSNEMREVAREDLPSWLAQQSTKPRGAVILAVYLGSQFPENRPVELLRVAERLLLDERYKVSRALTTDALYFQWRGANYGSVPKDFNEDMYHAVNASYCDFFVTDDVDQATHAAYASNQFRPLLCDTEAPLLEWLPLRVA